MGVVREVSIVAPAGASLGIVLQSALASYGWATTLIPAAPVGGAELPVRADGPRTLVVIEDDRGRVRAQPPPHLALDGFVCVGSIQSIGPLIMLASRGATVLNQAAPIVALLRQVQNALLAAPGDPNRANGLAELMRRQAEARTLARLTPAENEVLRGMVAGLSATEMASVSHHSVHTIRSQIKAILSKLGVGTQVAAVAIAHRSGQRDWMNTALATFTNFSDDPARHGRDS